MNKFLEFAKDQANEIDAHHGSPVDTIWRDCVNGINSLQQELREKTEALELIKEVTTHHRYYFKAINKHVKEILAKWQKDEK